MGADAFTGDVPTNEGATDKAAATIGQGRNLASPLSMAVVAGTIARGSFVDPTLVAPGVGHRRDGAGAGGRPRASSAT